MKGGGDSVYILGPAVYTGNCTVEERDGEERIVSDIDGINIDSKSH